MSVIMWYLYKGILEYNLSFYSYIYLGLQASQEKFNELKVEEDSSKYFILWSAIIVAQQRNKKYWNKHYEMEQFLIKYNIFEALAIIAKGFGGKLPPWLNITKI